MHTIKNRDNPTLHLLETFVQSLSCPLENEENSQNKTKQYSLPVL